VHHAKSLKVILEDGVGCTIFASHRSIACLASRGMRKVRTT